MPDINQNLSQPVKKLLWACKVKVKTYSELVSKTNFTFEAITHQEYLTNAIQNQKALHLAEMNLIGVDDEALISTEDTNELVLHELVHIATKKLGHTYEAKTEKQTEECIAQIGMFKLVLVLGLNPAPYADRTLEYLKQFPKANFRKAEITSDRAVEYLVKHIGMGKMA